MANSPGLRPQSFESLWDTLFCIVLQCFTVGLTCFSQRDLSRQAVGVGVSDAAVDVPSHIRGGFPESLKLAGTSLLLE